MVSACCPGDGDEDLTYSRQKPTALLVGGGRRRRQSAALSLCNGGCFPATGWWYILGSAQSLVNGPDDGAEGAVAHVALYWVGMICWFPEKRVRCLWRYGLERPGVVNPLLRRAQLSFYSCGILTAFGHCPNLVRRNAPRAKGLVVQLRSSQLRMDVVLVGPMTFS